MLTDCPCSEETELSHDAVRDLYSTHARELWALYYAKCNDHVIADDVLSEAFTRLLQDGGAQIRNPRAWLIRVGNNLLIDYARRQKRRRTQTGVAVRSVCHVAPEDDLMRYEGHTLVRDALRDLREDDRLVLILRYGLGYSTKRISALMETSVPSADLRLTRARRRLARALGRRGISHASDIEM